MRRGYSLMMTAYRGSVLPRCLCRLLIFNLLSLEAKGRSTRAAGPRQGRVGGFRFYNNSSDIVILTFHHFLTQVSEARPPLITICAGNLARLCRDAADIMEILGNRAAIGADHGPLGRCQRDAGNQATIIGGLFMNAAAV